MESVPVVVSRLFDGFADAVGSIGDWMNYDEVVEWPLYVGLVIHVGLVLGMSHFGASHPLPVILLVGNLLVLMAVGGRCDE